MICVSDDPEQNTTSTPRNLNRLFIAYADTGKHIIGEQNCWVEKINLIVEISIFYFFHKFDFSLVI